MTTRPRFICVTYVLTLLFLLFDQSYTSASERRLDVISGMASWYSVSSAKSEGTSGSYTASGLAYNNKGMTCALPNRDFYGWYRVTSKSSGKSVMVLHTDIGPSKKLVRAGRVIDLSPAAFAKIGRLGNGLIEVEVARVR